ncbi:S-adenosylmethionine mitochondrial carrier protein [Argonauta hians]
MDINSKFSTTVSLLAGGAAGTSVDVLLFPLDTMRTRLQSQKGFQASGGFRGIYSGLGSAVIGSAPSASLFFLTYEFTKHILSTTLEPNISSVSYMAAAAAGEVTACLIRVPVEVVKQRAQTSLNLSSLKVFQQTLQSEGIKGLYRGYGSTVAREIPFSFIQFPLWEYFKTVWSEKQQETVKPWQSSICGALAGGIAAGTTTPLDVAKTRIMLAKKDSTLASGKIIPTLKIIYFEKGVSGLYAGIVPRTMWISAGGAIFLGIYDEVKHLLSLVLR